MLSLLENRIFGKQATHIIGLCSFSPISEELRLNVRVTDFRVTNYPSNDKIIANDSVGTQILRGKKNPASLCHSAEAIYIFSLSSFKLPSSCILFNHQGAQDIGTLNRRP